MGLEFWKKIWDEGVIRFHQAEYNKVMVAYFEGKDLTDKTVFIPLAGKTKDINYFLEKGAKVIALEFCEKAIEDYFSENARLYNKEAENYISHNLTFVHNDFFDYKNTVEIDYIYDRASAVVFNSHDRQKYYDHLVSFSNDKTNFLIYSIDHIGPPDFGPPYKITKNELQDNFKSRGVELKLFHEEVLKSHERLEAMGVMSVNYFVLYH